MHNSNMWFNNQHDQKILDGIYCTVLLRYISYVPNLPIHHCIDILATNVATVWSYRLEYQQNNFSLQFCPVKTFEILKCIKWINFLTQFTLMKLFDSTSRHILLLKVNSFLSVILVSSNEPKNNKKIVRISALASKKRSNEKSSVREPK